MVVVISGRKKQHAWNALGSQVHSKTMLVQALRPLEIADVEVNVTHGGTARNTFPGCVWRGKQIGEIQGLVSHVHFLPAPRPCFPLTIGVNLYRESIRICDVESFADEVVTAPCTGIALAKVLGKASKCSARGQQQRGMVQAEAFAPQGTNSWSLFQLKQDTIFYLHAKLSEVRRLCQNIQPNQFTVELQRAPQVRDDQPSPPHDR